MTKELALCLFLVASFSAWSAHADDQPSGATESKALLPSWFSLHFEGTAIDQGHPGFPSSIPDGPQSMPSHGSSAETVEATLFLGIKIDDLELYADPEMDQGFGLANTFGLAGFTNGSAGKVGQHDPYFQLPHAFARYVVDLGGDNKPLEDSANQVATSHAADNVTLTLGKFAVTDIFDNNTYAHDPRADFENWSIIDMGAFDYAANAYGYTYGGTVEWAQDWWSLRAGLFDMSRVPNDKYLNYNFNQYQTVFEAEERHTLFDHPGKVRALFFLSSAQMGSYDDALDLAAQTGTTPSTALVRERAFRPGGGINIEQELTSDLGGFLRMSMNDGSEEAYEYTDINKSLSGGLSLKGTSWDRADDTIGLGGALNALSKPAQSYFAAGGLGILIGDGSLNYASEDIIEAYYRYQLFKPLAFTFDYQFIGNPAYNQDRGPIHVFGARANLAF